MEAKTDLSVEAQTTRTGVDCHHLQRSGFGGPLYWILGVKHSVERNLGRRQYLS